MSMEAARLFATIGINGLGEFKAGMAEAGASVEGAAAKVDAATTSMAASAEKASARSKTAMGAAADGVGAASTAMHNAGMKMTMGMTVPLVAIGAASVKMASDFQSSTERLRTQAGASQQQVEQLRQGILGMAQSVGTSPDQLSAGMYHVVSSMNAILPPATRVRQELEILKVAAQGAQVGGSDLEDTTYALASAMNALHEGGGDAKQTMGELNAIVGAGDMTMTDLVNSLKSGIIPTAASAGVSLQSLGAAMAVLGDMGVRGAMAGTHLRMAIALLASPSAASAKVLDTLGMSSKQATSTSEAMAKALEEAGLRTTTMSQDLRQPNGILVALQDLNSHLQASGMTATGAAAVMDKAFGGGKMGSTIVTLAQNTDRLSLKFNQIGKDAGSFGADFDATSQTTAFKFHAAEAGIESDLTRLGTAVMPVATHALQDFGDVVNDVSEYFENLSPAGQQMALRIAEITAAVGPALLVMGSLGRAVTGTMLLIDTITGSESAEVAATNANTAAQEALTAAIIARTTATQALVAVNGEAATSEVVAAQNAMGDAGWATRLGNPATMINPAEQVGAGAATMEMGAVVNPATKMLSANYGDGFAAMDATEGAGALGADAAGAAALGPETAGLGFLAAAALGAASAYKLLSGSSSVTAGDIAMTKTAADGAASSIVALRREASRPIAPTIGPAAPHEKTPLQHATANAGMDVATATAMADTDKLADDINKVAAGRQKIIDQSADVRSALALTTGASAPDTNEAKTSQQLLTYLGQEKQRYLDLYAAHKIGSAQFLSDERKVASQIEQVTAAEEQEKSQLASVRSAVDSASQAYISAMVKLGASLGTTANEADSVVAKFYAMGTAIDTLPTSKTFMMKISTEGSIKIPGGGTGTPFPSLLTPSQQAAQSGESKGAYHPGHAASGYAAQQAMLLGKMGIAHHATNHAAGASTLSPAAQHALAAANLAAATDTPSLIRKRIAAIAQLNKDERSKKGRTNASSDASTLQQLNASIAAAALTDPETANSAAEQSINTTAALAGPGGAEAQQQALVALYTREVAQYKKIAAKAKGSAKTQAQSDLATAATNLQTAQQAAQTALYSGTQTAFGASEQSLATQVAVLQGQGNTSGVLAVEQQQLALYQQEEAYWQGQIASGKLSGAALTTAQQSLATAAQNAAAAQKTVQAAQLQGAESTYSASLAAINAGIAVATAGGNAGGAAAGNASLLSQYQQMESYYQGLVSGGTLSGDALTEAYGDLQSAADGVSQAQAAIPTWLAQQQQGWSLAESTAKANLATDTLAGNGDSVTADNNALVTDYTGWLAQLKSYSSSSAYGSLSPSDQQAVQDAISTYAGDISSITGASSDGSNDAPFFGQQTGASGSTGSSGSGASVSTSKGSANGVGYVPDPDLHPVFFGSSQVNTLGWDAALGVGVKIMSVNGWDDGEDEQIAVDSRAGQDGEIPRELLLGGSTVTITGIIGGSDQQDLYIRRKQLKAMFVPTQDEQILKMPDRATAGPFATVFGESMSGYLRKSCRVTQTVSWGDMMGGNAHKFTVTLRASDPRRYDDVEQTATTSSVSTGGGFTAPMTAPLSAAHGAAGGVATVNNGGDYAAPWTVTIAGPVTNPIIEDTAGAGTLSFSNNGGLVVPSGDTLVVDLLNRTAYLNGDPTQSKFGYIDFTTAVWWLLAPGASTVRLRGSQISDPAAATVEMRSAYV